MSQNLFSGPPKDIILIVLDGFGWASLERFERRYKFLQRLKTDGILSQLTSLFPSTTTGCISSLHFGMMPAKTGLYEWNILEPSINRLISPLPYSLSFEHERESLYKKSRLNPDDYFPTTSFYQRLKDHGIKTNIFQTKITLHQHFPTPPLRGLLFIHTKLFLVGFVNYLRLWLPNTTRATGFITVVIMTAIATILVLQVTRLSPSLMNSLWRWKTWSKKPRNQMRPFSLQLTTARWTYPLIRRSTLIVFFRIWQKTSTSEQTINHLRQREVLETCSFMYTWSS